MAAASFDYTSPACARCRRSPRSQRHDRDGRWRHPPRHRRDQGARAWRALRVGRPSLSLCRGAAGEAGVSRAISLLHAEIDRDLALLGIRSLKEITPDLVRKY